MAPNPRTFTVPEASVVKTVSAGYLNKMTEGTPFSILDDSMGNFMSCHDRFHNSNMLPMMAEQTGNVFITRPKLNLSSPNLKYERLMAPLNTYNPMSSAFMIRCLLDTYFATDPDVIPLVADSPLLNPFSPFLLPACNGLVGISGWPDFTVETESTEGGYYSENQTYAIGSDRLYRTYNFNLTFKDVPSSPIFNLFFYWLNYMASVTLGDMLAYPFHIDALRLNYTVSIYQFIMDPTKRYILKWGKATGCFPVSLPVGDIFSFSEQSMISEGSGKLTIPFVVNNVKYQDPLRIMDFNILVQRYAPGVMDKRIIKFNSPYNHVKGAVPYIVTTPRGYVLTYRDMLGIVPEEHLEPTGVLGLSLNDGSDVPSTSSIDTKDRPILDKSPDSAGIFNIDSYIDKSKIKLYGSEA